jgi:hypothetical protein
MIKHIVFFRLLETKEKPQLILDLKSRLEALPKTIDAIDQFEVGINFSPRDAAYDLALLSDFKTRQDLDTYNNHPDHQKLVGYLNGIKKEIAIVDYEY